MRLMTKFSLIYILVFGLGLAATGYLFYGKLHQNAREQVLNNAEILMETALAVRSYTNDQVKPTIEQILGSAPPSGSTPTASDVFRVICAEHGLLAKDTGFHPQTVPAFSAAEMFSFLRKKYPEYSYKEAATNPTNPRNRAVDWEEDILKVFKDQPNMKSFDGTRMTPFGPSLFLARPMRAGKSCMECHSVPSAAPPSMLKLYGNSNGFGWKENDIIAAQIISVPLSLPVKMARNAFHHVLVSLGIVAVLTLIILNLVLYFTVIRPVRHVALRADEISKGDMSVAELPVPGRDEISVLAAAFNRMNRSLVMAMKMLEKP